ncbi:MAG: HAMP domain-containing sensor histidine kinase [Granulosicoccus sp.]
MQYVQYVQNDLGNPPDPVRAQALADELPVAITIYQGRTLLHSTTGQAGNLNETDVAELIYHPLPRRLRDSLNRARSSQEADTVAMVSKRRRTRNPGASVLRLQRNGYTVYYRLLPRPGSNARHTDVLLYALAALGIVLFSSYTLIRRQLAPIRKIQRAVSEMGKGELDKRIAIPGDDDLADLGNSIDAMAARQQAMLDAKRQLLLAISHELRSPIARARIAASLLPESVNRQRIEEDLLEMQSLITDIMESEQLQQHAVLNRTTLAFDELVQTEINAFPEPVTVTLANSRPVTVFGDAARLRILVRNLVANALQHGRSNSDEAANVTVGINKTKNHVELHVLDEGPGIAPEHRDRITDAFYRPDDSRSRNSGGFGLGLTLAKLVAEAHDGSLSISDNQNMNNTATKGTHIIVRLPVTPEKSARET